MSVVILENWECLVCDYFYEPLKGDMDNGIKPGTYFEDLPNYWVCPVFDGEKDQFKKLD